MRLVFIEAISYGIGDILVALTARPLNHLTIVTVEFDSRTKHKEFSQKENEAVEPDPSYFGRDVALIWETVHCLTYHCQRLLEAENGFLRMWLHARYSADLPRRGF